MSKNPDIIASFTALRRAARRALEIGLRTGTPVCVLKRGKAKINGHLFAVQNVRQELFCGPQADVPDHADSETDGCISDRVCAGRLPEPGNAGPACVSNQQGGRRIPLAIIVARQNAAGKRVAESRPESFFP